MFIFGVLLCAAGLLFCAAATRIRKGDLSAIHSYHTRRVAEGDRRAYGARFARGMYTMGAGQFLAALSLPVGKAAPTVAILVIFYALGLWQIGRAQRRYNGGWFS